MDPASPIARFNPRLDSKGVLRLRGRLDRVIIPEHQKSPALLPDVSHIAKLLISEALERTLHGRQRLLTAYLRQSIGSQTFVARFERATRDVSNARNKDNNCVNN